MAKVWIFLGVVFALAALAWMAFLPAIAEHELRAYTGFDVRIKVLAVNPLTGHAVVRGFVVHNPEGYPLPDFIELQGLDAEIETFSIVFGDRLVIDSLDLDAAKLAVVRRHDGMTNFGAFIAAYKRRSPEAGPGSAPPPETPARRYLIKRLHLRLGQLVIADYTGNKSDVRTYSFNIDHTYSNVSDPRQLLVPDVVHTLYSFGLHHDAAQLLPGDFGRTLADGVDAVAQVSSKAKDAAKRTGVYFKGLLDKLEQSAKP